MYQDHDNSQLIHNVLQRAFARQDAPRDDRERDVFDDLLARIADQDRSGSANPD
ncbi:hypothetical protein [Mesobaculum littorinae]|uniref:hypothetical protein n=1 Tax=Mesobaculum littorinae TaxID=2486419 RepID=UPI0013E3D3D9|nr:hypothetical protein [Mesobaculum littorinae]